MENKSSSGIAGILGLIGCILLLTVGRRWFPRTAMIILVFIVIVFVLALLLTVFVTVLAFRQPKDSERNVEDNAKKEILSKAQSRLMELRRQTMRIREPGIHSMSMEICSTIEKILKSLREHPEDIQNVRQFLNYYLPTMGSILSKYVQMEERGVLEPGMTGNVTDCLRDISTAMEKQYRNLFEDDKLDLSVEMEALTLACKRDGLLDDKDFNLMKGER